MIVAYPTPGKEKARVICEAFARGAGGQIAQRIPERLPPGVAPMFYGVTPATAHLFNQAKAEGREFYYADNAYFDPTRETYFRVTRNRLQHRGDGASDGARFAQLKLAIEPWRVPPANGHLLVCPQSDEFMQIVCDYAGNWTKDIVAQLREVTTRAVVVRPWNRNKAEHYRSLPQALRNCWAVVTWSSASAITALLRGVPAICMAEDCIARPLATPIEQLEDPLPADLRRAPQLAWAEVVADNQWTLQEMANGVCWRMLSQPDAVAQAA